MKNPLTRRAVVGVAALALAASGCSAQASDEAELDELRYMVPNTAGSGWDTTARTAAKIMEDDDLLQRVDVFNVDGANGTVGLSRLVSDEGNAGLVMQMGFGLVAATVSQESSVSFEDTTPIVKLIDDYLAVIVPADSPYDTLEDLQAAWLDEPGLKVGGGSAIGGADHLAPLLIAEQIGLERSDVDYISLGGSEILPAVLGGQVDFGFTSAADVGDLVEAGELKALAVTGPERFAGLPEIPTLGESGIDVEVANWRGVVAPPELDQEEVDQVVEAFDAMHASDGWQEAIERNGWVDAYMSGEEFGDYLDQQSEQISDALEGLTS